MKRTKSLFALFVVLLFAGSVRAQLTAHFGATPLSGCSPIVVQFSDSSTGGAVSWLWDLGNGSTSTVQNPSKTYTVPGTYSVTLTITDAAGNSNTQTRSNIVTVIPKPQVSFTASDSMPGCAPKAVAFTPNIVAGVPGTLSYTWDFGDGTLSNSASPTHIYATNGNFDVTLSVTNAQGCNKSITKAAYIKTVGKPASAFSFSGNSACALPVTVAFANATTGSPLTAYQWSFGNGLTSTAANPTIAYTAAGTYPVRLISAVPGSGCADTLIQNVTVTAAPPTASFTAPASGCIGVNLVFNNTSTPASANVYWDFGDGSSSFISYLGKAYYAPGIYTVKLIAYNGSCTDTTTKTITIYPAPTPSFSINPTPATGCSVPKTFTLTNNATGATSYNWAFGDGATATTANPSKTYTAFGTYNIVLTATSANGCTTTSAATTVTLSPPTLSILASYPAGQCVPAGVNFSNTFSAVDAGTTYSWNFGDGSTGSGAAPSHTYATAGSYTVTLTATAAAGCTATTTTTVNLGNKPTAAFTATPLTACTDVPVPFTNSSAGGTTYLWNFGDGSTSTLAGPSHAYGAPGTYTVTLIASDNGCTDTLVRPSYITIIGPIAQFTDNFVCSNKALHNFTNTSTGALSYLWNFGDGTTSATTSPSHTYASAGSFLVTLQAVNGACTSTFSKRIYIQNMNPQFTGTPLPVCKGQAVNFTLLNTTNIQLSSWSFGDGTGTPMALPAAASKVYNATGFYTVKLFVTDSAGCVDSLVKPAYVNVRGPVAGFKALPTGACPGTPIQFTDTSTVVGGAAITGRSWSFGDGTTLAGNNATPVKSYPAGGGVYDVALTITDANGCTDSSTRPAYIQLTKPTAAFVTSNTFPCSAASVTFTNTGNNGASFDWNFGDGTTANAVSATKIFAATGTYNVRLISTGTSGCKDTVSHLVVVDTHMPFAKFTVSDSIASCPPLAVQFTAASGTGITYLWKFGNGATATTANPSTLYSTAATFTAKLIATNANGCVDSTTKTIKVDGPAGTLSYTPIAGCAPLPVTLTVNATGTVSYTYDFDNGITQTITANTVAYTYPVGGIFKPVVILSNGVGCNVAIDALDTIKISSLKAGFIASATSLCPGKTVQFTDTSVSQFGTLLNRLWDFGDGTTATTVNPIKTYTVPGTYTVKLRLSNGSCTDSTTKTITVFPSLVQGVSTNATVCIGTSATLNSSGASSYVWSPGATLSCTTCASPTATPAATTVYTVIATAANGCSDTDQITVMVAPKPPVSAGPDVAICTGAAANLLASGAASYSWNPDSTLTCTPCAAPAATPATTTSYVVTGTSAAGCTAKDTVIVTVNSGLVLTTNGPSKTICAGSTVGLTVSGATGYTWSPAAGLSCTTCGNPTASPASTTTYTITGNGTNSCPGAATITVIVNPLPVVSVAPNPTALCAGASASLVASGASSYLWTPATGLSCTACAVPTAAPASTITYTVTGTNANGCMATATVPVTVNPLPTVTAITSQSNPCAGALVTLTAGGAVTYVWSPAAGLSCTTCATPTTTATTNVTYTVTGTNAAGCTATASVAVDVSPLPILTTTPAVICAGGSTVLAVSGASTYVWSPATGLSCTTCAAPTAAPVSTATYTVAGTNALGCTASKTLLVTVNPLPVITVTPNPAVVCAGSSIPLTASGSASYSWSPATGLSCTNCASPTATPAATTAYIVTGTGSNGCTATATVPVTVSPIPVVTATASQSNPCSGTPVTLTAGGATSYAWSPATGLSCANCASPAATPAATTTYTVTGTTAGGCTATASVTITVKPLPALVTAPATICMGGSVPLSVSGASVYVWSPATGLSCTACASPTASPASTTTYTVTGTSANGCTTTQTLLVTVNPLPVVSAGPDREVCAGISVTLSATGAATYEWSPAAGLNCTACANPVATISNTTTYTVTGTSGTGCIGNARILLTVVPRNPVSLAPPKPICEGESVQLNATGGGSYSWSPASSLSNASSASPVATPAKTTTYTVVIRQGNCYSDTLSAKVVVSPIPTVDAGLDRTVIAGTSTQLLATATDATLYQWTPAITLSCADCAAPYAAPLETTTYTVEVRSDAGCTATDVVTLSVQCDNNQLFVPNTFTPNGDGTNDVFYPRGKGIREVRSFRIYSRWGELLYVVENFQLNEESKGWNGTFNHMPLPPDVYVWVIDAFCDTGAPLQRKGDVSIVK